MNMEMHTLHRNLQEGRFWHISAYSLPDETRMMAISDIDMLQVGDILVKDKPAISTSKTQGVYTRSFYKIERRTPKFVYIKNVDNATLYEIPLRLVPITDSDNWVAVEKRGGAFYHFIPRYLWRNNPEPWKNQ